MVVAPGDTDRVPLEVTVPIDWLMLTLVAFVELQVSVLELPVVIVAGDALSVTVGIGDTVTVAVAVTESPALLVAVMV